MSTYTPDINNLIAIIETNIPDNTSQAITAQKVRTAMESVAYNYDLYALKADMQEYITQSELSEMSYATQSYVMDRIAEIPSVDLSGYVSKDELSAMGYVTETQLQQAAYATESYVNEKISEIPAVDLSAYATKTYVAEYVSTYAPMPDLSSYVTKSELSGMGYVTGEQLQQAAYVTSSDVYSILDNSSYVTSNELSDAGYINTNALDQRLSDAGYITSSALNGYATEAYVADYVAAYAPMPDLSSYVTKTELNNAGYITSSALNGYATETYVAEYVSTYAPMPDLSSYVTKSELSNAGYITSSALNGYATEAYVADYVAAYAPTPDLSAYVTKTELDNAGYVTAAYLENNNYAKSYTLTQSEYDALIQSGTYDPTTIYIISDASPIDLSSYVTKTELDNMSYATTTYVADYVSTYAPMPDLSSYVTKTELSNAGYITSSALNGYATTTYVADYVAAYAPTPDLSSYVTKNELEAMAYAHVAEISSTDYELLSYAEKHNGDIYVLTDSYYEYDMSAYATKAYVVDYVNTYGGGGSSVVIDENIVPKADNTYTLGDSSYMYKSTYTNDLHINTTATLAYSDNTIISYNAANIFGNQDVPMQLTAKTSIIFKTNGTNRAGVDTTSLRPWTGGSTDLGRSDRQWRATYTQNLYLDGTEIKSYIDTYYYPKSYVDTYFVSKAELAACGYLTYSNFQYDSVNNTLTIII